MQIQSSELVRNKNIMYIWSTNTTIMREIEHWATLGMYPTDGEPTPPEGQDADPPIPPGGGKK